MPATLTLENIPDALYERLKLVTELHRRSLDSQAIICLECVLIPTKPTSGERIARARELRKVLAVAEFRASDIDVAKRAGRK